MLTAVFKARLFSYDVEEGLLCYVSAGRIKRGSKTEYGGT